MTSTFRKGERKTNEIRLQDPGAHTFQDREFLKITGLSSRYETEVNRFCFIVIHNPPISYLLIDILIIQTVERY